MAVEEEPEQPKEAKGKKKVIKRDKKKVEELREQAEQDSEEEELEEGDDGEGVKAKVKKKKTKANRFQEEEERVENGVIAIRDLPKGLEERELKLYFSQFGELARWKIARSPRSGGTKGHAWVEFKDKAVAEIVAKTMDKYMIFGKVLKVKLIPRDEVPRHFYREKKVPEGGWLVQAREDQKQQVNFRPRLEVDGEKIPQRTISQVNRWPQKMARLKEKLEKVGIDYDLSPFELGQDEHFRKAEEERLANKVKYEKEEAAREAAEQAWKQQKKPLKAKKEKAEAAAEDVEEPAAEEQPLEAEAPDAVAEKSKTKKKAKRKAEAEAQEEKTEDARGGTSGAAGEDAEQKTPKKKTRKRQAT